VLGPSPSQIEAAARSFHSVDNELERAEEEAERLQSKVRRLRQQRKLLADRWYRVFRRGLKSLEELEAVEAEERRQSELLSAGPSAPSDSGPLLAPTGSASPYGAVPSEFKWLGDFSLPGEFPLDLLVDPVTTGETVEQVPGRSPNVP